jgi:ABC-type multidrug transport system fused ATPase/permease subunit
MTLSFGATGELLARYLGPQRGRVALLAALLFGSIGLQVLAPQVVRWFIDAVGSDAAAAELTQLGLLFVGVALVQQLLRVGATYVGEVVGWTASNRLRADVMHHCLGLDLGFHKSHPPGQLIERIDGDVTAMANFFAQFVIQVLGNVLLLFGIVVALWLEEWRVGLPIALFAVASLVGIARTREFALRHWRAARQVSAELYGFIEERLGGLEDLRASGAGDYVVRRLLERAAERVRVATRARTMAAIPWIVPVAIRMGGQGLVLVIAAYLFQQGAITMGTAFVFVFYVRLIFQPIEAIGTQIEEFQRAAAGIVRVRDLMSTPSALPDVGTRSLPDGPLMVSFDAVSFGYGEADAVLDDLSFELPPGQRLGLLGRTGSGKTTIARLLLRLYDPAGGAVRLGGVDLREVPLPALRRRIGMVTQEVQLFQATLRDNLSLFDRSLDDARLLGALESLGLGEWLAALPSGLDTQLGPSGVGLSAGEAQLVAFTRVFLRDPGLVILDEASSRLDPATERLIEHAIAELMRGRTVIVIAHRLSTVATVDRIMVLEAGRIAEHGDRAALAADRTSRFATLLRAGQVEMLAG